MLPHARPAARLPHEVVFAERCLTGNSVATVCVCQATRQNIHITCFEGVQIGVNCDHATHRCHQRLCTARLGRLVALTPAGRVGCGRASENTA